MPVPPFAANDEAFVEEQVEDGVEVAADRHVTRPAKVDALCSADPLELSGDRLGDTLLGFLGQPDRDDRLTVGLVVSLGGVLTAAALIDHPAHVVADPPGHVEEVAADLPVVLVDVLAALQQREAERHLQPDQHQVPIEGIDILGPDEHLVTVGQDLGDDRGWNTDEGLVATEVGDHHGDPIDRIGPVFGSVGVDGRRPQEALRQAVFLTVEEEVGVLGLDADAEAQPVGVRVDRGGGVFLPVVESEGLAHVCLEDFTGQGCALAAGQSGQGGDLGDDQVCAGQGGFALVSLEQSGQAFP
jgi:hypothetical protein